MTRNPRDLVPAEDQLEEEIQWLSRNLPDWDLQLRENAATRWLREGVTRDKVDTIFGKSVGAAAHKRMSSGTDVKESRLSVGSKLTVGPNIKLKGVAITDCDLLVVEGFVEATIDARLIVIAENGCFRGSVQVNVAEIHGIFEGDLLVREKLVIFSTGRVSGRVQYGHLIVENGGHISGNIAYRASNALEREPDYETHKFAA